MQAFLDEWLSDFKTHVPYVIWAAISLIGGLAGPFGTFDLYPVGTRLLIWSCLIAFSVLVGTAVRAFVQRTLGLRDFRRGSVLIAVLVAALMTLPLAAMAGWIFADHPLLAPSIAEIGSFVFFASLAVGAFRHTVMAGPNVIAVPEEAVPAGVPLMDHPRLVYRLHPLVRGPLVLVSVRDHYVDVVTDMGRASLLMRLSDAIAETEGEAGAQVHRSHWVARRAATHLCRDGDRLHLVLTNGARVPVSRNHRPKLDSWALPEQQLATDDA